jgi:hypothetical protein
MNKNLFYKLLSVTLLLSTLITYSCSKDKVMMSKEPIVMSDCQDTISFSQTILPMISDNCFSCHNSGTQPTLNNHSNISNSASLILKTMRGDGVSLMPQGGPALPDSLIQQFACWFMQGKQNN